jgi:conjugal transfer pilus assembly protein TraK
MLESREIVRPGVEATLASVDNDLSTGMLTGLSEFGCKGTIRKLGQRPTIAWRDAILLAAISCSFLFSAPARADGFPDGEPPRPKADTPKHVKATAKPRGRDPLAVDAGVAVQDKSAPEINLPGVMKLEGADRELLDPTRVRKISWTNGASQTVWVSATQPNRIQLPFADPRVVSTSDLQVDKKATSNNVYVYFGQGGVAHAVQIWMEPPGEGTVSVGLQLVPKDIPAQSIIIVDDTVEGSRHRAEHASPENDRFTRVQALLEQAALGDSPAGYSVVDLQLPPLAVDGVAVAGMRRLSGRNDDIYVYAVTNPGAADAILNEKEFDGADVEAVSIVPKPLLRPGEKAVVTILAKKREAH